MEDMLGLNPNPPKFVRQYARLGAAIEAAVTAYAADVRSRAFPGTENVYPMKKTGRRRWPGLAFGRAAKGQEKAGIGGQSLPPYALRGTLQRANTFAYYQELRPRPKPGARQGLGPA